MSASVSRVVGLALAAGLLLGVRLMSSPRTAVKGNLLGSACMLGAIALALVSHGIVSRRLLWLCMAIGGAAGWVLAVKVAMIQMPQMVALLNGLGGGASAIVGFVVLSGDPEAMGAMEKCAGATALVLGGITLSGSGVAAGKLDQRIRQLPIVLWGHTTFTVCTLGLAAGSVVGTALGSASTISYAAVLGLLSSLAFGALLALRVGGADMPITISVLNSLSGVAASVAGFAVRDPLLVVVGAIVGTAGLVLTQIMCRAMNRSLLQVLVGRTPLAGARRVAPTPGQGGAVREDKPSIPSVLREAKTVVIVPGYGMALAQAQGQVGRLIERLEADGKVVRLAIHPVAGRMPGHMNVLLAEAGVPYEKLFEMDQINPQFKATDLAIVVGANDVVNPAAGTAEGTLIYGMPVLRVDEARHVIVCNKDTQPGYAGVDNPLYGRDNVILLLGDAADTVAELVRKLDGAV